MQASQANAEAALVDLRQQIGGHSMELVRTQQQLQALSRQYSAAAYQLQHTGALLALHMSHMRLATPQGCYDAKA